MKKLSCKILALLITLTIPALTHAQSPVQMVYKTIDTTKLTLNIYYPPNYKKGEVRPAIVLFFGGGWINGTVKQMEPQAKHFTETDGMIAITADYRVASRQKTTPFDAVRDAKSAIRFVRSRAAELGIDPMHLAAGGGSTGGHIAAAADLTELEEPNEDKTVSARPDALVLFNPVFNNGPDNYGYERIGNRYLEISPFHNIKKGAAPTIAFFGTKDKYVPVGTAEMYKQVMEANGSRCDLFFYEDQNHGFFNYKAGTDNKYFNLTMQEADKFLKSLGYVMKP
ncbi:alpha/beta hydrolase [Mucilaginibacter mali]|uniref:Alpha/beta hydrolase n=1 Tax=Mucilaginibacter mali TaxID=2740462 RepID=A0A7D4QE43_9SPHI|nr:alpha/beta hydrolase [Mucilaginibacter mali]QKJ31884.1 alpha/beta hydrolase [Mucilaginibacter mali]